MNSTNKDVTNRSTDPLNFFNLLDLYISNWKSSTIIIISFLLFGTLVFYLYPNRYEVKAEIFAINSTSNNYDTLEFSQDISNEDLLIRFYKAIFDSDLIEEAAMEANIIDYYSSIQEILGSINVSIDKKNLTTSILYTSKDEMLLEESKLFIINLIEMGNNAVIDGVIQTYENRKKDLLRRASVITNAHESEINERIIKIESEVDLLFQTSKDLLNKRIYSLENNLRIASKLGINETKFSPEIVYSGDESSNNRVNLENSILMSRMKNNNMYMELEEETENFPLYLMGVEYLEAELELKKHDLEFGVLPSSITFLNNKKKQLQSQMYKKEFIEGLRPIKSAIDSIDIAINEFKNAEADTIYFDNKAMLSYSNTQASIYMFLISSLLIGLIFSGIIILYSLRNKNI